MACLKKSLSVCFLLAFLCPMKVFPWPVVVKIFYPDRTYLSALAQDVDIWEVNPACGYVLGVVEFSQVERLRSSHYSVEVDEKRSGWLSCPENVVFRAGTYRTVEEIYVSMLGLRHSYPSLVQLVDFGDTWERTTPGGLPGYELLELILTNQEVTASKPVFFLLAGSHAREMTTVETAMLFAEFLLDQYGYNPDITWLLDWTEIHVVPVHNPDGRKWAEQGYYWRKNTDTGDGSVAFPYYGVDLNRNFDFHWDWALGTSDNPASATYRGRAAASEPETLALQFRLLEIFPNRCCPLLEKPAAPDTSGLLISLHSYGEKVLWPWGDTELPAPNAEDLARLGERIAFFNNYQPQQSSSLYPTSGTVDDWAYGRLGVASLTLELGTEFFQDYNFFRERIWPDNCLALLYAGKASRAPYLVPFGPEITAVSLEPERIVQGGPVKIKGRADLTRLKSAGREASGDGFVAGAYFSVDSPPWVSGTVLQPLVAEDGTFNTPGEDLSGVIDTTFLQPGRHTVFVEGYNERGIPGVAKGVFLTVVDNRGDLDNNMEVDIRDLLLVLRMVLQMEVVIGQESYEWPYPEELLKKADFSGDGVVEVTDVISLLRKIIGLPYN